LRRYAASGELGGVFYYKDDVVTGYTYEDKNGQLLPVKPLPGGNGKVLTFFSNGNKSSEMEYQAGLLNGPNRLYHANGKLYYESFEDYNNSNGKLSEYFENGTLKSAYLFAVDKEDGPYKEYHENGTVKEEGTYTNGSQHGTVTYYDAAGKRIETRTYYFGTLLNVKK
jgi:antitoxin component YwqK of YwqJK toxin-antitoxin module